MLGQLIWSPAIQKLLRKVRLLSTIAVISHTYCVVEVYGFGISGRIFSEGAINQGRYLLVEVYSVWNSLKYTAMISAVALKAILHNRQELLVAGLRGAALTSILRRLYFEYSISCIYTSLETNLPTKIFKRIKHLDKPNLPDGLPQSVPEVIASIQIETQMIDIKLSQELFIDTTELESSAQVARREYSKNLKDEELERLRQRKLWQETPLRKRGLVLALAVRGRSKLMILSCYRYPKRPLSLAIKCHISFECASLPLSLSLPVVGPLYHIYSNPYTWSNEQVQHVSRSVTKQIRLHQINQKMFYVYLKTFLSAANELRPLKDYSPPTKQTLRFIRPFVSVIQHLCEYNRSPCLQSFYSTEINDSKLIKSRRDVGRGMRIYCRCHALGAVPVIVTIYLVSSLISKTIDPPPAFDSVQNRSEDGGVDYDAMNAYYDSLCECFDIDLEVYIPQVKEKSLLSTQACSSYRVSFSKEDVFRLVGGDLYLMSLLTNVSYVKYLDDASKELRKEVTNAWRIAASAFISCARWYNLNFYGNGTLMDDVYRKIFITSERVLFDRKEVLIKDNNPQTTNDESGIQWCSEIFRRAVRIDNEDDCLPQELLQVFHKFLILYSPQRIFSFLSGREGRA